MARSGYQVGSGAVQISQGDYLGGGLNILGGGLGITGGVYSSMAFANSASAPLGLMHPNDTFFKIYDKYASTLAEPGFFDVVAHGSGTRVQLQYGTQISANALRRQLVGSGYTGGPIRLVSCSTGALQIGDVHGVAQALANKMKTTVRAPSTVINVTETLSRTRAFFTLDPDAAGNPGQWIDFNPTR